MNPNKYGYHAAYTAQADPLKKPFSESLLYAVSVAQSQPSASNQSATQVCNERFAVPTPCDLLSGQVERSPDVLVFPSTTSELPRQTASLQNSDPNDIVLQDPADFWGRAFAPANEAEASLLGAARSDGDVRRAFKAAFIENTAVAGGGYSKIATYAELGFMFTLQQTGGPCAKGSREDISLDWSYLGHRFAVAMSGVPGFGAGSDAQISQAKLYRVEVNQFGAPLADPEFLNEAMLGDDTLTASVGFGPFVDIKGPQNVSGFKNAPKSDLFFEFGKRYAVFVRFRIVSVANARAPGTSARAFVDLQEPDDRTANLESVVVNSLRLHNVTFVPC